MLKRQLFEDSESKETEPRISKCQRMGVDDKEERQSLDEYKDEDERGDIGYVPFPFIASLPP